MTRIFPRGLALAAVASLLSAAPLAAAEPAFSVTVSAGKHDRQHAPVKVLIEVPAELEQATTAELSDGAGNRLVGQLTAPGLLAPKQQTPEGKVARELHFILPEAPAGQSLTLEVAIPGAQPSAGEQFAWNDTPGKHAELSFGERPVLRYMYEALDESTPERRMETYKVYHHVYDPQGKRLVTKGPGGLFPHHRGLYYGFNRISYGDGKRADTWHCNRGESQAHQGFLNSEAGPVLGRHRLAIGWHGQDQQVFAREQREMTVYNTPGGLLIEFASRLESQVGPIKLDGDPQHAGFQFRASQHVPEKTKHLTYYLRPDGKGKPGSFRNWPGNKDHADLPWNALSFVVDEQRYTCCYLDHPQNPKEARYSERDYGRFGSYFEYELDTGRPLDLNYRVWLQEGEMTVEGVNDHHASFVEPPQAEVKAL